VTPLPEPRHSNRRPPSSSGGLRSWHLQQQLLGLRMASGAVAGLRVLAFLALLIAPACDSSPVDCRNIAPSDCAKYPQCFTFTAARLNEQCVFETKPVGCGPDSYPVCTQYQFFVRDPAGTCWIPAVCFIPSGWTYDDGGVCGPSRQAMRDACFPKDGGVDQVPGTNDAEPPD
jgi:hypothetical protein